MKRWTISGPDGPGRWESTSCDVPRHPRFWKLFKALPAEVRQTAKKNYALWKSNPNHPSLDFKQAHTRRPIYSMKVGMGWRVLGTIEGDIVTWFWIGSHNEYDKLLKQL